MAHATAEDKHSKLELSFQICGYLSSRKMMSQQDSNLWLVLMLISSHLLCPTCAEISSENRGTRQTFYTIADPGLRTIDALSGNCGKWPDGEWSEKPDAFCKQDLTKQYANPVGTEVFPSHVHLEIRHTDDGRTEECAGILVHPDAVLTANRCITDKAKAVRATVGKAQKATFSDTQQTFAWGYCKLYNKKKYDPEDDSDVVLLLLRKPFSLNERVKPVCLELNRRPNNSSCYAAMMAFNDNSKQILLHHLPVSRCQSISDKQGKNTGRCYESDATEKKYYKDDSVVILGSGVYCADKCDKSPVVYAVGLVARGFDSSNNSREIISVSKILENKGEYEDMLQNCYEIASE